MKRLDFSKMTSVDEVKEGLKLIDLEIIKCNYYDDPSYVLEILCDIKDAGLLRLSEINSLNHLR